MAYVNPAELFAGNFRPKVQAMLPIVPALVQLARQKENQKLVDAKWQAEAPVREAQARHYNAQSAQLEAANNLRSRLLGGEGQMPFGLTGVPLQDIQKELAYKSLGLSMPKEEPLKSVWDENKRAFVAGKLKEGDIIRPEAENYEKIDYWINGPQGWRKTSEQVPKEGYNQRMKEIEAQGGRLDEPPEIDIQKAIDQYRALAPEKLMQMENTLKARGIDTSKWSQQQKLWYQVVKDKANREIDVIKFTARSLKEAQAALNDVENTVFQETQKIAVGQPPTYLTPPQQAPKVQPQAGPLPIKPKGAQAQPQPQTTVMPKRLPGESVEQYIQRVGQ